MVTGQQNYLLETSRHDPCLCVNVCLYALGYGLDSVIVFVRNSEACLCARTLIAHVLLLWSGTPMENTHCANGCRPQ